MTDSPQASLWHVGQAVSIVAHRLRQDDRVQWDEVVRDAVDPVPEPLLEQLDGRKLAGERMAVASFRAAGNVVHREVLQRLRFSTQVEPVKPGLDEGGVVILD